MVTKQTKQGDDDRNTSTDRDRTTPPDADEDMGLRARSRAERYEDDLGTGYGYADDDRPRRRMVYRGREEEYGEVDSLVTAVAIGGAAVALEAELLPGVLIGAGAMLLGRMFPQIGGLVRPVLKTAVRAGYAVTDTARGMVSEASGPFRDVVDEVRSERGVRRARYYDEDLPRTRARTERDLEDRLATRSETPPSSVPGAGSPAGGTT
jgi:hypothetical protein